MDDHLEHQLYTYKDWDPVEGGYGNTDSFPSPWLSWYEVVNPWYTDSAFQPYTHPDEPPVEHETLE